MWQIARDLDRPELTVLVEKQRKVMTHAQQPKFYLLEAMEELEKAVRQYEQ